MQIFLALLIVVCLSACTNWAADDKLVVAALAQDDNQISWSSADDALRFDIYSPSGLGSAAVRMIAGQPPPRIVLRFHLSGLEELRFAYGSTVVTVAVASIGDAVVFQQVAVEGAEAQAIAPDNPHWMKTQLVAGHSPAPATIPLTDGYFEVEVPPHFLHSQQRAFRIEWVDFYR